MILPEHRSRPGGPVYFVSDAHIGTASPEVEQDRQEKLLALLAEVEDKAAALVIVGDLFDFWFEYRHAIPRQGFRVLARLRRLVEAGLPIQFFGGNHDWWAGSFLTRELGLVSHSRPADFECQNRRLFVAHGDGLAPGDTGYRLLRRLFRNPLAISAYRLLHPDIGIPLATRSSHTSRRYTETQPVDGARLFRTIGQPEFRRGRDAVLIGHFHHPIHVRQGHLDFLVNGDWMTHFSCSILEGGAFRLELRDCSKVVQPTYIA